MINLDIETFSLDFEKKKKISYTIFGLPYVIFVITKSES